MAHYLQGVMPYGGQSSQAAHASHHWAMEAAPRALSQVVRYLALLRERPEGVTDAEAARLMGLERSSINARRKPLEKIGLVVAGGFRPGPTGTRNTVWILASREPV